MPALGAYLLLLSFFLVERRLRQGQAARSFEAGEHDRRSTVFIGAAFGTGIACVLLAPALNAHGIGSAIPRWLAWVGLFVAAGGLTLRIWAPRQLGRFYTRTLRTDARQTVVDEGPYRVIRHPGYAGVLALWIGAGLAVGNLPVVVAILVAMLAAYAYRIRAEERMLVATLGQPYRDYQARTWRLLPFFF
jgi:protein-S-isoprenylcysteine O-methyltransferase